MSENGNEMTMVIDGKPVDFVRKDSIAETVIKIDNGSSLANASVGMMVIVRSRNEGVNAGIVEAADETGIILRDARRLWYHKPRETSASWYEGVSVHGLSDDSKVSATVKRKFIVENYSITECNRSAFELIMSKVQHAQR